MGRKWLLLWSGDECTLETLKISETISEDREKLKLSLRKQKKRERIALARSSDSASPFPFNNHQRSAAAFRPGRQLPQP